MSAGVAQQKECTRLSRPSDRRCNIQSPRRLVRSGLIALSDLVIDVLVLGDVGRHCAARNKLLAPVPLQSCYGAFQGRTFHCVGTEKGGLEPVKMPDSGLEKLSFGSNFSPPEAWIRGRQGRRETAAVSLFDWTSPNCTLRKA
jgi:hypothetical protein